MIGDDQLERLKRVNAWHAEALGDALEEREFLVAYINSLGPQVCPYCGKSYKRIGRHLVRKHKRKEETNG